jgi:hypothetical protein
MKIPDSSSRAVTVQELIGGAACKYEPDDLTYADGSEPSSSFVVPEVPNGQSKSGAVGKKKIKGVAPVALPPGGGGGGGSQGIGALPSTGFIRTIDESELSVSSGANSKNNLLDYISSPSSNYWTSTSGSHPHTITLTLDEPKRSKMVYSVELYSYNHSSGYDPSRVKVQVGADIASLSDVNTVTSIPSMNGWYEVASPAQQLATSKSPPRVIRIEIYPGGSNCKISGVRLVAQGKARRFAVSADESLAIGDRVVLADNFAGGGVAYLYEMFCTVLTRL